MTQWKDAYDSIIGKIDAYLVNQGWEKNEDGEWEKLVTVEELGNPGDYIGQRPLSTIMLGGALAVYGDGPHGVASFISESYTTKFEEKFTELIEFSDEELSDMEDESMQEDISSYIQSKVRPYIDEDEIADWLHDIGW